jgi:hypothetical protein
MDYLDPNKELRQRIILLLGYVLIAAAIVIATIILVYQSYGFKLNNKGTLIQTGLLFFSSEPNPGNIYINGTLNSSTTNTRLFLASGIDNIKITRTGYRDWTRTITVDGGAVEHFDYPFLFPNKLTTTKVDAFASAPGLVTQSPDRHWLLVEKPGSSTDFDLYNIKNPAKPTSTSLSLPSGLVSKATSSESWKLVAWADDNQHVLLQHVYDNKTEYILVDRSDPAQSVNLTTTYNVGSDTVELSNDKYNQYFILNPTTGDLTTASLGNTTQTPLVQHVLAFKTYGTSTVLYITNDGAPTGKVLVKMLQDGSTYTLRSLPVSTNYLVDLTTYSGTLYVAVGSDTANKVYIYQNPVAQLGDDSTGDIAVPLWVLNVNQANFLSFSDSAQFIMAENGNNYAVYDIENNMGYKYTDTSKPLDNPQASSTWMDGDRLIYVSGGKLIAQDYDNNNMQTLVDTSPNYVPAFSADYHYLFTLAPSTTTPGQYDLDRTPLLIPADL